MGLCMTKEQTVDGQMVEDPINFKWSPLYAVLARNRRWRQTAQIEVSANIELHLTQEWFHGKLEEGRSGRLIAEQLLMEYYTETGGPDGSFLVRESGTVVGDYVLSIWWNEKVQHCRIHWWQGAGVPRFFLTGNQVFDSRYNLITHYQETPLRYHKFEMRLTELVPQANTQKSQE